MPIMPATFKRYENEIIATVERIRIKHRDNPAMFRSAVDAYVEGIAQRFEDHDSRIIIRSVAARHANRAYAKVQDAAAVKDSRVSRAWRLQETDLRRSGLNSAHYVKELR